MLKTRVCGLRELDADRNVSQVGDAMILLIVSQDHPKIRSLEAHD